MVRTYKRKKDIVWTTETMERAVSDISNNVMTVYCAAKFYKIPKSTLRRHLKTPVLKVGKPTVLTVEEEDEVVQACQLFAKWGFELTRVQISNVVGEYCKSSKKSTPFRDGVPGIDWWNGFCRRHPTLNLVAKTPKEHQKSWAIGTVQDQVNNWLLYRLKPELDQLQLLGEPQWIFSAGESSFLPEGTPGNVLVKKGIKSLVGRPGQATVHTCISGDGQLLPPYVVYKGKHVMASITNDGPLGTRYTATLTGLMTTQSFVDWLRNLFIPYLPAVHPTVLLILDEHVSPISYEVSSLTIEHGIHILRLPSHIAHLLQPLDMGVLKEIKSTWYKVVGDYVRQERKAVTKSKFPGLLRKVWQEYKPEYGKSGFRKAGIHPFILSEPGHSLPPTSQQTSLSAPQVMSSLHRSDITSMSPSIDSTLQTNSIISIVPAHQLPTSIPDTCDDGSNNVTTTRAPATPVSTVESSTRLPPRQFFAEVLTSSTLQLSQRQLTGVNVSIPSEEAIHTVHAETAKQRSKTKKLERKRKREKKQKSKRRKTDNSATPVQKPAECIECATLYDDDSGNEDWVECESCLAWYHVTCAGLGDLSVEEINSIIFICNMCTDH